LSLLFSLPENGSLFWKDVFFGSFIVIGRLALEEIHQLFNSGVAMKLISVVVSYEDGTVLAAAAPVFLDTELG
jgi:hypothetical protein